MDDASADSHALMSALLHLTNLYMPDELRSPGLSR